jgi:hypothetical protein
MAKRILCAYTIQPIGNMQYRKDLITGSITGKSIKKKEIKDIEIPAFITRWMEAKTNGGTK